MNQIMAVILIASLILLAFLSPVLIEDWLKYRRRSKARQAKLELARAEKCVRALGAQHAFVLNNAAHEACLALVQEALRVSSSAPKTRSAIVAVAKSTTTSCGSSCSPLKGGTAASSRSQ